jgi:hypothetical protein
MLLFASLVLLTDGFSYGCRFDICSLLAADWCICNTITGFSVFCHFRIDVEDR